jgi:hypothetical protein
MLFLTVMDAGVREPGMDALASPSGYWNAAWNPTAGEEQHQHRG